MALQGTIETFALPEVLRMLGSGAKSGRLRLSGDRGSGSVWIEGGKVVGAEATGAPDGATSVAVIFELLRYGEGSFTFDADDTSAQPGIPQDIEVVLGDAERRLGDWKDIEAVVPSLAVGLALAPELPKADVVVDADRWKAIVAVADGRSAAAIADALDLDELEACRRAKDMVEAGLLFVTELEPPAFSPDRGAVFDAPGPDATLLPEEPERSDDGGTTAPRVNGFDATSPLTDPLGGAPSYGGGDVGLGDLSATDASYADALYAPTAEPPASDPYLSGPVVGDPYETERGFGAPIPEASSSARAELDAMASGFGLNEPAEPSAYDQGFGSDGGAIFDQGFGSEAVGGFDQGFASDPSADPAFSFAAPEAAGADLGGSDRAPDAASSMGAGAALFAEDLNGAPASVGGDALFAVAPSGFDADDTGDAAEVARQLANLSPKAARAVAAAARATTAEEREAALAEVTSEGDEPINRGLLLKFLSSVQA